jgi:hypothetical protein
MDSFGIMSIFVGGYDNWIEVAELLPDVYRFIWGSDSDIVACLTDPRCVAPEHYTPPEGAKDLSIGIPDEERGVIPIWRLQIADYVGSLYSCVIVTNTPVGFTTYRSIGRGRLLGSKTKRRMEFTFTWYSVDTDVSLRMVVS